MQASKMGTHRYALEKLRPEFIKEYADQAREPENDRDVLALLFPDSANVRKGTCKILLGNYDPKLWDA